ncbi:TRAP transporter large permease subunit [Bosea sp. (in: a-proteobacteria)]|uniref:TRAP transporter large permease n=1 Tax=Bosea sp. (in: a-proteobacteria) TaxID=1871050 RepID=UPI00086BDD80|nr:TRAP transporter large permease subunit [Bosea sp. (in: a-proteobacteria)]MBN9435718.1 TRAP transporter large permease subunit [Bosea sp. (in: a-proteobacteria)]MBN9468660.1 TRAP transporter large permease subunit [Bosea sp. (in: a-proteobacteria)]ODT50397.1 MAG: C4-dicarboxylate ABC transporter permease [Methylobacterium sp. SCN 67-24]
MDPVVVSSLVLAGLLLVLLAGGVWVALSLLTVGMVMMGLFTSAPMGSLIASTLWDSSWGWALTSLPLFIWMGEILFRSKLSSDMFQGLAPWVSRLPGRLLHVNVLGCGIMAAVAGSSAVTCATIGRMSVPELQRRNYPLNVTIGTLAGSGTLGLLIPPSIIMIVYGVTAEVSIARLFIAGVVPGLLLMVLFMGYTAIWSLFNADKMPPPEPAVPFLEKLYLSRRLIPVALLIGSVVGSIYGGIATPTEAATIGVIGALILAVAGGGFTRKDFMEGLMSAMRTSCMISFIIACAACLTIAVAFVDIPRALASWVAAMNLSPYALLAVLAVFMLILGCFLEGISIIVLTSSVMLPMVQAAGIDLLWFGIFVVVLIEAAQITPPVGFNLFVLQSITGKDILQVTKAAIPYFFVLMLLLVLIVVFPQIVTGLPKMMQG